MQTNGYTFNSSLFLKTNFKSAFNILFKKKQLATIQILTLKDLI